MPDDCLCHQATWHSNHLADLTVSGELVPGIGTKEQAALASQEQFPFNQKVLWQPSEEYLRRSRLKRFMDRHGLETLDALMEHSTADLNWFCNFRIIVTY